jgi:REP element-mobilizing transposase RayT
LFPTDAIHRVQQNSGHAALRQGRASTPGQIYLVTFVTDQRRALFLNADMARLVASVVPEQATWKHSRLLAWVLMPDHWHGLIELGESDTLPGVVCRLNANTSRRVRLEFQGTGPVWASAFHDRALRRDEHLLSAARYLVLNPVRAGLVTRVGDYSYWNAIWL